MSLLGRYTARLGAGLAAAAFAVTAAVAVAPAASAQPGCSDVEVIFARGTGERPGLGVVGSPFARAVDSALPGRSVNAYAVNYPASSNQNAGPGSTDMSRRVASVAQRCPNTQFVIGGYSQGATVTNGAIGIRTGFSSGETIPAQYADRVKAVVVYGSPLNARGRTIAGESRVYGPKAVEYCNTGDNICGGRGNTSGNHFSYPRNGTVPAGAQFAAARIT